MVATRGVGNNGTTEAVPDPIDRPRATMRPPGLPLPLPSPRPMPRNGRQGPRSLRGIIQ